MKKALQEFDEKIDIHVDSCGFCAMDLDEFNISYTRPCVSKNGVQVKIICQCLTCAEVLNRMIDESFQKREKGCHIPLRTEQEVRAEVEKEGWTNETLRAKEERYFNRQTLIKIK